jgi:hypothetical protein
MEKKTPSLKPQKRPWRMIRRTSPEAVALVALLDEQGVTLRSGKSDGHGVPLRAKVTERKIEDLSEVGLLAPDDASPKHVVAHFQALDALDYGAGKQTDETSLRMLSDGFGTERARFVLAGSVHQLQMDLAQLDGDAMPSEITDTLDTDTGSMKMIAPVMKQVFAALADVPNGGRDTYNGELLTETPDARKVDFFDGVGRMMSGRSDADPGLAYDVAFSPNGPFESDPKLDQRRSRPLRPHRPRHVATPDEVAIVEEVTEQLTAAFGSLPEIVANTPIMVLAQMAVAAKAMLTIIPEDRVPGFDDRRREVVAAFMALILIGLNRAGWAPHPQAAIGPNVVEEGDPAA